RRFLANLIGVGWTSLLQLGLVPVYVRVMGIEAYGLIGFYVALIAILQVVEIGLGPTINREMARAGASGDRKRQRNALRTLELIYGASALLLGVSIAASSQLIADYWVHPQLLLC